MKITHLACFVLLLNGTQPALNAQIIPPTSTTVTGVITSKLFSFDETGGPGAGFTQFLEGRNAQTAWSGNRDSGFYADLDLDLTVSSDGKEVLGLERHGFGRSNHRGGLWAKSERFKIDAFYSHYRSATDGVDFVRNPGRAPGGTDPSYFFPAGTNANSGYLAQFNLDTSQTLYRVDRTTFGIAVRFTPAEWGSITLRYDGYQRTGNEFVSYALGAGDVREAGTNAQTAARVLQRWRGFDRAIDEFMNRFSVNVTVSPGGDFQVVYDGSVEKFDNRAKSWTHADIPLSAGWQYNTGGDATRPLGFVPDSTLTSQSVRLSKTVGDTAVSLGYGESQLTQDRFTRPQITRGYTTGKIATENAFLLLNHELTPKATLEGQIRYANRDNDSTYPVAGLIGSEGSETLAVRINQIESLNYSLAATIRQLPQQSTLTAGWRRVDRDRDLTFNSTGIIPGISFYREETKSDEIFARWVARPAKGVTIRVTPSYLWADKTALVNEPENAFVLKTSASHTAANGRQIMGYYTYRKKENGNNSLSEKVVLPAVASIQNQDSEGVFHAAGASFAFIPAERVKVTLGVDWTQSDLSAYYLTSDRRRYENPTVLFLRRDRSESNIDTKSIMLGGEWQPNDDLVLTGGYTLSNSKGDLASGLLAQELATTIEGRIDDTIHCLDLGARYAIGKKTSLRLTYRYEKYDDAVFSDLSGAIHTMMLGLAFSL